MKSNNHTSDHSKKPRRSSNKQPQRKKVVKEESFGVVPVYKKNGDYLFLIIQHRGGHWAFPKGHPEKDETPILAARRELREETGIAHVTLFPDIQFTEHYRYSLRGEIRQKTVVYFLGMTKTKEVKIEEDEVSDYRWSTFKDAQKLLSFKEGRGMLESAYRYLSDDSHGGKRP